MVCEGYTKVWDLAAGDVMELERARGATLRVTRGTIWITLERDTRDIVLEAGDVFTIDRNGLTLVEAQNAAAVCVLSRRAVERHVRWAPRGWQPRLAQWLHAILPTPRVRRSAPYY